MSLPSSSELEPASLSDLIFPYQSLNIHLTTSSLKKSTLTIKNRLRSIEKDAQFVRQRSELSPKAPVIANERCGSWYIAPYLKTGSVYFKSTDGHVGQWAFSLRRLNLQLLPLLGEHGKVIIVDSTRQGKRKL